MHATGVTKNQKQTKTKPKKKKKKKTKEKKKKPFCENQKTTKKKNQYKFLNLFSLFQLRHPVLDQTSG